MYHQTRFDTRSDGFRLIFSLCDCACVLMRLSLCPYADMHVSLCQYSRVLMLIYMRPYVTVCMSLHTTKHRSISHNRAINELRNLGLYPVNMQATPRPRGTTNITQWPDKYSFTFSMRRQNSKVRVCYV